MAVASRAVASRRLAISCAHSSHPARCRSNLARSGAEIASMAYAPARVRTSGPVQVHSATPRQSRSRISASRIRVLIVPVGTPSRLATWP